MTKKDLNPHNYPLTKEQDQNLDILLDKLNKIDEKYHKDTGKSLIITSGVRNAIDQMRINPTAPKSKHLSGEAADNLDNGLWQWILKNLDFMHSIGISVEDPRWTHSNKTGNWIHIQSVPPKSKRMIFIPSNNPPTDPNFWDGKYDKKYNY